MLFQIFFCQYKVVLTKTNNLDYFTHFSFTHLEIFLFFRLLAPVIILDKSLRCHRNLSQFAHPFSINLATSLWFSNPHRGFSSVVFSQSFISLLVSFLLYLFATPLFKVLYCIIYCFYIVLLSISPLSCDCSFLGKWILDI